MKRAVNVVEALAVVAILVFVVALFANEPDSGGGDAPAGSGEAIYAESCASCHGADGGGGRGPQLSDGEAVANFPDVADQIAVVTDGEGGMPSFEGRLTEEQITEVVDYTRTL